MLSCICLGGLGPKVKGDTLHYTLAMPGTLTRVLRRQAHRDAEYENLDSHTNGTAGTPQP